jgi:tetratricopeptide (TPR) repeat protein
MLYQKWAVHKKTRATKAMWELAREHSPFDLSEIYTPHIGKTKYAIAKGFVRETHKMLGYDHQHRKYGTRNATETYRDGRGHCVEQNILLSAMLLRTDIPLSWMIVKNPKGYEGAFFDIALHLLVKAVLSKRTYIMDAVSGDMALEHQLIKCVAKQDIDMRELVAFYLQDSGDDLALRHDQFSRAHECFDRALAIDPNNYTIHISKGDAFFNEGELTKAEEAYRKASEMTPKLMDALSYYGDFLFEIGHVKLAKKAYALALQRKAGDKHIINELETRLQGVKGFREIREEAIRKLLLSTVMS